jgi:hypothetical protein
MDLYRNSNRALGDIIQEVFLQREAIWQVDEQLARPPRMPATVGAQSAILPSKGTSKGGGKAKRGSSGNAAPAGRGVQKPQKQQGAAGAQAAMVSTHLKDNTPICGYFNRGSCNMGKHCHDRHMCGGSLANGRACGGRHPASRCTNPKVPKRG